MSDKKHAHLASEWVNAYSSQLLGFAISRVKDEHLAKDLVQETFVSAWKNIEQYNGEASVKTWLTTILKNKIIDHYRKASTRLTDSLGDNDATQDVFFDDADHWAKAHYPQQFSIRPNNNIEKKEFYTILAACRKKLKAIQDAVFSLKYLDGMDSETICKELNISPSNYWVLIHRAKVQLRGCIETKWINQ
ncbi:MAG: sigma-70 family RNA polymerase sigma factor [Sediminibacterium sp.]|jgi:RNA polymerase sigma-70 factor (TIGR02943 family)|nr:sigma-70 family RNA polymerase sigma factor [Sediminibacterium sp.]MBX9780460.1 sigma-70 family RNA polymerase sigma factor [Chitinophagaceae bacterium]